MQGRTKVLITGANGLLGRHIGAALSKHHDVHAIVYTIPEVPLDGVEYRTVDFSAEWSTKDLPDGIDTIIHLAQSAYFREFPDLAMDIFRVNIDSTARLLDYAYRTGIKRLIFASTGSVYGSGNKPFSENAQIVLHGQLGCYVSSKLCCEMIVQNYTSLINTVILRIFFMYGPDQKNTMLIPRLVDSVENGRPIFLQGEEGIQINPIYVSDVVDALLRAMVLEGNYIFNIAGPEVLSLRQIGVLVGQAVQKQPIFEIKSEMPKNLIADIQALRQQLWTPKVLFRDGIRAFLESR